MCFGHGYFFMLTNVYIDGYNLYHAIDNINKHELKWLNLRKLSEKYLPANQGYKINTIYYFTAIAYHKNDPKVIERHKAYIFALESVGVKTILGNFKEKDNRCFRCDRKWKSHEEKETDVNIATFMLFDAFKNNFDRALLITQDSDLSRPLKKIKENFPEKNIRVITPLGMRHSAELADALSSNRKKRFNNFTKMKEIHLSHSLFPETVEYGSKIIKRPLKYRPE